MKKTKFLAMMLIALATTLGMVSCSDDDDDESAAISKFTIDQTAATLTPGQTLTLNCQFFPEDVTDKSVSWTTSDASVATVDAGVVTAVSTGTAIITATPNANPSLAKTCAVTVAAKAITASGDVRGVWDAGTVVTVNGQLRIPAGESLTIKEGVEVIFNSADANGTGIELTVEGNIYCLGTENKPVVFTIPSTERKFENVTNCNNLWGGIMINNTKDDAEALFSHCVIEYAGSAMIENSPSVKSGIYTAGEDYGVQITTSAAFKGSLVVSDCVIRNGFADGIYMQGGKGLITHNTFECNGATGGEAVNVKAGTQTVIAYNIMYSPNTNGLKLSSSGQDDASGRVQSRTVAYNNTIINAGWRRDGSKGGCIYVEKNILANVFNNLMVNCKYRAMAPKWGTPGVSDGCDDKSVIDYNCYISGSVTSTLQQDIDDGTTVPFINYVSNKNYASGVDANSLIAKAANDIDIAFANYPYDTNPLAATSYNDAWDLSATRMAAGATNGSTLTSIVPNSLTVNGTKFTADAPQQFFGAKKQ